MKLADRVYIGFVGFFVAVMIWAAFDLHNRIPFVMFAQAPVLLGRILLRKRR